MKQEGILPSSPEAEQGVLSSFLQSHERVAQLCMEQGVTEHWFLHPIYCVVYQGLMAMHKEKRAIDMVSATDFFVRHKEAYNIGDATQVVTDLFCFTPSATNVDHYLEILRECYAQRAGIIACREAEISLRSAKSLQDVFNATSGVFVSTHQICEEHKEKDYDKEAMLEFIDRMEKMQRGELKPNLVATTLPSLNEEVGGLKIGELTVITGLPGAGKSVLGNNFIRHAALDQNKKCMVFSMEMPTEQLLQRMCADVGGIRMSAMRVQGIMTEQERRGFMSAVTRISKAKIALRDFKTNQMTPDSIEAAIRKHKKNYGCDVVLIDYLQLLKTKSKKEQRRDEELSSVSSQFKQLAQEIDIAVIMIAAENREGGVRGSQGVEYDADNCCRMVPVKNKEGRVEDTSGIYIEKWREGRRGWTIPISLDGPFQRITERND